MDLTKFLGQDTQEQSTQRLSKEEYAAQKKQEREEIWGMIDGKAQEVFQNGDSLKGFLDFMGQCKPQRTDNLFLLYAQNPEIRQVKTFEKWKEEGKVVKTGSKGYNFIVGQEYEKDGVIQQGYSIQKAYPYQAAGRGRAKADGPADGSTADRQRGTDSDCRPPAG